MSVYYTEDMLKIYMYVPAFPADRIHYQVKMCKDSHIDLGFHSAEAEERISMQQSRK